MAFQSAADGVATAAASSVAEVVAVSACRLQPCLVKNSIFKSDKKRGIVNVASPSRHHFGS
jgi:hypothetical protein